MIPVITPIIIHEEIETCPNCGKEEDIAVICRHCKKEYPEEVNSSIFMTIMEVIFWFIIVLLILSLLWTFMVTVMEWITSDKMTLIASIKQSVHWWGSLFSRIY